MQSSSAEKKDFKHLSFHTSKKNFNKITKIYSFFIYIQINWIHLTFHTFDTRDSRDYVYCIIIINYIISIVPIQLNSCHINKKLSYLIYSTEVVQHRHPRNRQLSAKMVRTEIPNCKIGRAGDGNMLLGIGKRFMRVLTCSQKNTVETKYIHLSVKV